jgi:putative membrane protein
LLPLYLKALHLIFVVTWFAGLFYIVRLFIYHAEAESKPEHERTVLQSQYKIMEKRLWLGITWPSMALTLIFGLWLGEVNNLWVSPWFHAKLGLVFLLVLYHLECGRISVRFQKNQIHRSSQWLRYWNEVATLFLFAIVFLAILKNTLDLYWGFGVLAGITFLLLGAVYIYKKARK